MESLDMEREAAGNENEYAVRWRARSYVSVVSGALAKLRLSGELTDVTLSCEGRQLAAHRVLLAACSPYFRDIFKDHPSPHPVIVFRGLRHRDLLAVLTFIYNGEVSVPHARLSAFLAAAELLQVRGLCGAETNEPETKQEAKTEPPNDPQEPEPKRRKPAPREPEPSSSQSFPENIDLVCDSDTFQSSVAIDELKEPEHTSDTSADITIDAISRETEQGIPGDNGLVTFTAEEANNVKLQCDRKIIPSNSDQVKISACTVCNKKFAHPSSLTHHKKIHNGETRCTICNKSYTRIFDLKRHMKTMHIG